MLAKTPDEIKKGIVHCGSTISCHGCPYWDGDDCDNRMNKDALAYIQQLEAERDQLRNDLEELKRLFAEYRVMCANKNGFFA